MFHLRLNDRLLRAPGNDGGSGGDGGQQQQPGGQGGGEPYKPPIADMPAQFVGKDANDTLAKVWGAYTPLRDQLAKQEPLPKDVTGYKFEAPEPLKPWFGNADDPILANAKAAALKNGIAPKAFQAFLADTFGPAVEKGLLQAPFDPAKEHAFLGKLISAPQGEAGKTAINAAIADADATAKALTARLKLDGLSDAEKATVTSTIGAIAELPGGVMLLRMLKADYGEKGIKLGGEQQAAGGTYTKESAKAAIKEDWADPSSPKFDKAKREQLDAEWKRLFG